MTGTDLRSGPRPFWPRLSLRPLPGPAWALGLAMVLGFGVTPGASHGQQSQVVTIRSGSGWIGVNVQVVTSVDPHEDVITFTEVLPGSPAADAGLQPGDQVVEVNGVPVTADRFRSITSRLEAGDPIAITVLRDGEELELPVIAGRRPARSQIVAVRLQEELDSVRSHFVRILEAPEAARVRKIGSEGGRFVKAPTIHVEQVGADSIATRIVIHRPGGAPLSVVETPEGIRAAEWVGVSVAPTNSMTELEQVAREVETRARIEARARVDGQARVASAPATWTPLRSELQDPAERERAEIELRLREGRWPARSIEEVRPLSPYLAGLTRVAGAELRTLNPGLGQYFGVGQGLLVTEVSEGTPASEAGLRGGDVIVNSGGRPVTTLLELRGSLTTKDGWELEVVRAGERISITLR